MPGLFGAECESRASHTLSKDYTTDPDPLRTEALFISFNKDKKIHAKRRFEKTNVSKLNTYEAMFIMYTFIVRIRFYVIFRTSTALMRTDVSQVYLHCTKPGRK